MKIDNSRCSLISNLIILTALVFFTQLVFVVANMFVYLGKSNVFHSQLLHEIFSANIVLIPLFKFLLIQLVLYALAVFCVWYLTVSIGQLFKFKRETVYCLGIFFWTMNVIAVLVANSYFFPRSFFTRLITENLLGAPVTLIQLQWLGLSVIFVLLIACIFSLINLGITIYKKKYFMRDRMMLGMLLALAIILLGSYFPVVSPAWTSATNKKPNIILIGLDALRPDFVMNNQDAPQINHFLGSAINFTDAYTVVAQTFPSWVSMLTATEPKNNNARANLANPFLIDSTYMLPRELQQQGYETIFATDDLRFNTMLKRFGFNRVIGPPTGVNDFIIGSFNDFPLSNLLIRLSIGKKLFPYNYGNHEAIATYSSENFLQLVKDSLSQTADKPLFLAVHFNTSGWPFGTASLRINDNASLLSTYRAAIPAADKQFGEFLEILKQNHILDNAIVVLVSDHGITMGLPGDRLVTETHYQGDRANLARLERAEYSRDIVKNLKTHHEHGLDTSYGYGGDILSQKQYQVLLAFKGYGVAFRQPNHLNERVSLLDIAPTLLNILHYQSPPAFHGVSLQHLLVGESKVAQAHPLFLESYNNSVGGESLPSVAAAVQSGLMAYDFDSKTGFIFTKPEMVKMQLVLKERAIMQGDWLLADMPGLQMINVQKELLKGGDKRSHLHQVKVELHIYAQPAYMVLLNTKTKQWTTELNTVWAKTAPLKDLCQELHQFYDSELACQDCCQPYLRHA